jgi:hypothetical protein
LVNGAGSVVLVDWDFDEASRDLEVRLHGPSTVLRAFDTPGDVLAQFVRVVSAHGIGELITDSMRLTVDGSTFAATWKGHPADDITHRSLDTVMRHVIAELG